MKTAEKCFKVLDKFAYLCAALAVAGMLFCVTLQVVARTTQLSANWTTELSQYFFLWSTTFASYIAARRGKLIGVELVQNLMPAAVKRVMKCLSWATCGFFYALVIYYCGIQLPKVMGQTTPILKWSMGVIYIVMMIGLALLALYSVFMAIFQFAKEQGEPEKREKTAAEIAEEVE